MKIVRPTLLLDEAICKKNIAHIVSKANAAGVSLRPHFKTHQSHEIGQWFHAEGVDLCTVSSIRMAEYFAADGWKDITVAFPLNALEVDSINRLASSIKLNLCIVTPHSLELLLKKLKFPVQCYIEIDTGNHRTGIDPEDVEAIDRILSIITHQPLLSFSGFLSHAGHSYACKTPNDIHKVHLESIQPMIRLAKHYRNQFPDLRLSVGDTPICSVVDDFGGMDEIRPGNLVFYDLQQCAIGSSTLNQIAIAMACPVVAKYPLKKEIVVHGGAVHFSKDILRKQDGTVVYGEVVKLNQDGWELPPLPMFVKSLSQEHGILQASAELFSMIEVGDVLGILPVHSCLTADAMGEYFTTQGRRIAMMSKTS